MAGALAKLHKEVLYLMKMTRNILRRLEMKIHHAMTLDEVRKNAATESSAKSETGKSSGESSLLFKPHGQI